MSHRLPSPRRKKRFLGVKVTDEMYNKLLKISNVGDVSLNVRKAIEMYLAKGEQK